MRQWIILKGLDWSRPYFTAHNVPQPPYNQSHLGAEYARHLLATTGCPNYRSDSALTMTQMRDCKRMSFRIPWVFCEKATHFMKLTKILICHIICHALFDIVCAVVRLKRHAQCTFQNIGTDYKILASARDHVWPSQWLTVWFLTQLDVLDDSRIASNNYNGE